MSQFEGGLDRAAREVLQWRYFATTQLGRDLRAFQSPYTEHDPSGLVSALHLEDATGRSRPEYWTPIDRRGVNYVPWRFGAFVRRAPLLNAALVIEYQPSERRFATVKLEFEWEDELAPGPIRSEDIRACPLDRWVRLAAKAILNKARHNWPAPGVTTLYDRHDQALELHVHPADLGPATALAIAGAAPDKRREVKGDHLARVAKTYRAEMERAAGAGHGHARPTERIAEEFGVARSTAGRWRRKAAERGLLGPATGTRAGEGPPDRDT